MPASGSAHGRERDACALVFNVHQADCPRHCIVADGKRQGGLRVEHLPACVFNGDVLPVDVQRLIGRSWLDKQRHILHPFAALRGGMDGEIAARGGLGDDTAEREVGLRAAAGERCPAVAVVARQRLALPFYCAGVNPADAAVAPAALQALAQLVGEVIACGVGIANLHDAEFAVVFCACDAAQFFHPLRLAVAVVLQQACAAYGGDVVGLGSLGDGAVEA